MQNNFLKLVTLLEKKVFKTLECQSEEELDHVPLQHLVCVVEYSIKNFFK